RELADIDPGAGGIYRWVRRAFGPLHGFVAGWGYWVNNLFYFPSLLVATAAIAAYAGGPRFVRLGDDNLFIGALSLAGLWLGVGISGFGIVAMYVLGTAAMLVALPAETVSITNGVPQATAALTQRLGAPWLAPVAGVVAILLALGNLGGVGAWLAGSARLPFVAGIDGALPPAFGRIHPRWHTPHVGLLVQGGLATVFVVASLVGATVKNAYLALTQTTLILFFIPYLYLFGAYLRLRRTRSAATLLVGLAGLAAVAFSIV